MVQNKGFKPYHQGQTFLLSLSVEEFVPAHHSARIISAVVDKIDLTDLYNTYTITVGQNAFDPRMLVKVLFYSTFQGVFSSREIENNLHTDTAYMYLAAMQKPTYRTISRFRTRFFDELVPLFEQIITICKDLGLIGLNHIAFDGSKVKANASSRKSVTQEQLQRRIRKLLGKAKRTDNEEDELFGTGSPFTIPQECADDPDLMKKIEALASAYNQLGASGEKRINLTDEDAHLMKSKQSCIAAYNMQTAVDDTANIIVAIDVTTEETDYHQLIPMVEQVVKNTSSEPSVISADPGYATFENYAFLKDNGLFGLIPDSMHFIDTHGRPKYYPKSRFRYDLENDWYTCPAGRRMHYVRIQKDSKSQPLRLYRGNCAWCPLHLSCTKASQRSITRHPQEMLKDEMRAQLATSEGKKEYAKRITVAEAPFGNMKVNKRWIQVSHRGKKKVKGECILHAIGHNLGVICKRVTIDQVQNLGSINGLRPLSRQSANEGSFSSFLSSEQSALVSPCEAYHQYEWWGIRCGEPGWIAGVTCS